MSLVDSVVSYQSYRDDSETTIRPNAAPTCPLNQSTSSSIPEVRRPHAYRPQPSQPHHHIGESHAQIPNDHSLGRPHREVPDTGFYYHGSIEQYGWKPGQVPLFLEWYPEKLDRRSKTKFFESGKEYIIGRSPSCDIFFQNSEHDSGISAQHLKIKVLCPWGVG
jgi:FHA domain